MGEQDHIEGETLGQWRARHGLPGTDTSAARAITWRDGAWRNEHGGAATSAVTETTGDLLRAVEDAPRYPRHPAPNLHDEIRARSFLPAVPCKVCGANVARWVVREMNVAACNGCGATHVEAAPATGDELARVVAEGREKIAERDCEAEMLRARVAELESDLVDLHARYAETMVAFDDAAPDALRALHQRQTDAVKPSPGMAEKIRAALRRKPAAPPVGSVAALLAKVDAADADAKAAYLAASKGHDVDALYRAAGRGDGIRLVRDMIAALAAPVDALCKVVAEVLAHRNVTALATWDHRSHEIEDLALGLQHAKPEAARVIVVEIAAHCIAAACDAAKGGAK